MKLISTLIALGLATVAFAGEAEPFKLIHVKDLSGMLAKKDAKVAVYDANNKDTRTKDGVIPGATLLVSSKGYDTAKVLPAAKDTNVVFYCANKQCMASHAAAKRAAAAGYTNVAVLADGIEGWVKAGQAVTKVQ